MTRVTWDATGERTFEAGLDRGVLYVAGSPGVPWNGLRSIDEKASGAEVTSYFLDGEKYNQIIESEEFAATISAFTYPDEFGECDGTVRLTKGLFVNQQDRRQFGLSYRTKVGDDISGLQAGYKIHLVYNALAAPSNRTYGSLSNQTDPTNFQWDISTIPYRLPGRRSSAHYTINSRGMDPYILAEFEDILYGTPYQEPRMPSVDELFTYFQTAVTLEVVDNGDGTWTATGPDSIIQYISKDEFIIDWGSVKFIDNDTYTIESL